MVSRADKNAKRLYRHKRVRAKISGTPVRPRFCVYRSNDNIYVQYIPAQGACQERKCLYPSIL